MTIYRGTVLDTPESPFTGGVLRAESDAGIAVTDGVITGRGPFAQVRASIQVRRASRREYWTRGATTADRIGTYG